MHPLLSIATRAARNAGQIILRAIDEHKPINITTKGRNDFVTQIDKASERAIIETIHKYYPSHAIFSEECGIIKGDDYIWIIDPLDGTTNFIHGFPHFCISIALMHQGKIEAGLIYDPHRDELFTATKGAGAQLNNQRLRVGACESMENGLVATGFPSKDHKQLPRFLKHFEAIFPQCAGMRRTGSAALDLAYVAAGRFDAFWEFGLREWDVAAGSLIVQEAGGYVSSFDGSDDFISSKTICAANPPLHKELLKLLEQSS